MVITHLIEILALKHLLSIVVTYYEQLGTFVV